MSPDQALPLPLPIPTGRATSTVSAPTGVSGGSQDAASGFDALMAALGPVTVSDDQAGDAAIASATLTAQPSEPQHPADLPVLPAAMAVLPQLVADTQSLPPQQPVALPAVPAVPMATKTDAADTIAETDTVEPAAEAPAAPQPAIDVAAAAGIVVPAAVTKPAEAAEAVAPAATPARPAAPKARAEAAKDTRTADTNDVPPAVTVTDTPPPPVTMAQVQTQVQPQPQAPQTPQPAAVAAVLPSVAMPVPTPRAATVPSDTDGQAKGSDSAPEAPAVETVVPSAPVPVQPRQKPVDALAGSLKAVRKLTADGDGLTEPVQAAARPQEPSAFSLQAQAEAPGAYTATGAQTAGTTHAGSNLARATVETMSAMAVQVHRKLSEGNTKFAVELHPADLGKVEVTLSIARDGTTTAHLKFDTPVTAAAFQAQEGELRHQLAQTGLNLDSGSLTFSSRDDGNSGFGSAFAQAQQQEQQPQNRQSQARAFQNAAAVAADADISAASAIDAGLLALRAGGSSTLALNLIV